MRRRIIIGLGIYSVLFLLGGLYIVKAIHTATAKVDQLVMLHQVEILREHYLIQVKRVQQDLSLTGTRYARDFDTVVKHTRHMGSVMDACFSCHHSAPVTSRLRDLEAHTQSYSRALSRVLTMQAGPARLARAEGEAFEQGERLTEEINQMIALTGARLQESTQRSMDEIARTKSVLYLLVGVGPVLSAVLGFVFASGLTKPVQSLLESTRRLKSGDLDHRVVGLRHEFGELAGAFNEMAASLKTQMQTIQRAEQMALVGELSAGLAHEIKNPLAGIKVAMQILADEAGLSDEDREVVVKVGQEVVRLETLMKSFLNFARPSRPQPVPININGLLATTVALHAKPRAERQAGDTDVRIETELGELPQTMADPMQLQQVFLNLVINALDAMPGAGVLSVRTAFDENERRIRIEVEDSGEGVDDDEAERIFQPFFTTKRRGTGLGLAISRQVVEQHEGSISVGRAESGGAVFTILLPVRPVPDGGRV